MCWIRRINGAIADYASVAPPTEDSVGWVEVADADPSVIAFLQAIRVSPQPDYSKFRLGMLSDSGYLRITAIADLTTPGMRRVSRLENAIAMNPVNLAFIKTQWNTLVGVLPLLDRPTAAEVTQWKAIASTANMAFSFDSAGKMT